MGSFSRAVARPASALTIVPMPPAILAIDHVQITVSRGQEAAARAFYCNVLGLPEIEKPESLKGRGGFWVLAGDRALHVGTEDDFDRAKTKAHVAYRVPDIAAWKAHLTRHGVEILDSVPIPGHDRFEFRDPFGNRVELIAPAKS